MQVLKTRINTASEDFRARYAHNTALAAALKEKLHQARHVRPQRDLDRLAKQGKLTPRQRIERLIDPGTPFLETNDNMAKALEAQKMVVGKSLDAIDFIATCLILTPRVVLIDVMIKGDVHAHEVVRALRCFSRLNETKILVFTQFAPEDVDSMEGIEQLRESKNICMDAGAHKYIGRFTPATFWEMIKEFFG